MSQQLNQIKPQGISMADWVESRIARFEGRKYDWNALKFQADFDPKYRRAQMRYIGTGGDRGCQRCQYRSRGKLYLLNHGTALKV
ncbi:Uncharacterised protein [Providencia stuartii]|nr:Uncharacterised protein [Providencia stuartii]